jgi:hypothetical protein
LQFYEKILGWERPQIGPNQTGVVQIDPWHLKVIDKILSTPSQQHFNDFEKQLVLDALKSKANLSDADELDSLLKNFQSNSTSLRAFLESVSTIASTTKELVIRKGLKWCWMDSRQVRILGGGFEALNTKPWRDGSVVIDGRHINEFKNVEGQVIRVNDKSCTVAVTAGNTIGIRQEVHVPFEQLFDLKYGYLFLFNVTDIILF